MANYQRLPGGHYNYGSRGTTNIHPDDDSSSYEEDRDDDDEDDYGDDYADNEEYDDASTITSSSRPSRRRDSPVDSLHTAYSRTRPNRHSDHRTTGDDNDINTQGRGHYRANRPSHANTTRQDVTARNQLVDNHMDQSAAPDSRTVKGSWVPCCVLIGIIVTICVGMLATGIYFTVHNSLNHHGQCVLRPAHCDDWSGWSGCSVTCGTGIKTRTQTCYGNSTQAWSSNFTDSLVCNQQLCLGHWSGWSTWGQCSTTCGCGLRSRDRTCSTLNCTGDNTDHNVCLVTECKGDWSGWSQWGLCSATCGCGIRSRDRTCSTNYCTGDNKDHYPCQVTGCPSNSFQPRNTDDVVMLTMVTWIVTRFM